MGISWLTCNLIFCPLVSSVAQCHMLWGTQFVGPTQVKKPKTKQYRRLTHWNQSSPCV